MSIPLAATSVQIKNLTSFFYSEIKNTVRHSACCLKINLLILVLITINSFYLEALQVVFALVGLPVTVKTDT